MSAQGGPGLYPKLGFKWIVAPLTSMLKMTGLSDLALRELGTDEVVGGGGNADEMIVDSSKLSKSRGIVKSRKTSKA